MMLVVKREKSEMSYDEGNLDDNSSTENPTADSSSEDYLIIFREEMFS